MIRLTNRAVTGWIWEFILSFNLSWMLIWLNRRGERPFVFPWAEQSPTLMRIYWRTRLTDPPTVLEQVLWSLVLGIVIFTLLRLLSIIPGTRAFLGTVGGALAIGGFPLFFLLLQRSLLRNPVLAALLWIELAGALVVGALYYLDRLPVSKGACVMLLAAHFVLWAWASANYVNMLREIGLYGLWSSATWISTAFYFGFPVLGFCASIAWARYVRAPDNGHIVAHIG